jgi:PAS domain S-box-containing protein
MPPLLSPTDASAVQETLLGEALEHAPIGAIVLDENGHYLAVNRAACRLAGCTREELLELSPSDFAAEPESVPAKLEEMARGQLTNGTTRIRRRDGSLISIEYRVGATRSGGLPYFVIVFWERDPDAD